jgi:hypothetical protein
MKPKPLIPLLDYLRIHTIIRSVLDSVGAHTAHSCMFFGVAGAAILREFYGKEAVPIAGAAFYLIDSEGRNVLSFAILEGEQVQSTCTAFHVWVQCDGYIVDSMAPIFPETCASSGHPFTAPRRMFQRKFIHMSPSHEHLNKEGDFYLVPNPELIVDLRKSFLQNPANTDLVDVCLHLYKRPPKPILPDQQIQNDLGEIIRIKLKNTPVSGAW